MSVSGMNKIADLLSANSYPGRGIIVGQSADGKNAMIAYFIMGRSENSRNRIFERYEGGMRTKAFDESKLVDPSLIIYNPYLALECADIVTNGARLRPRPIAIPIEPPTTGADCSKAAILERKSSPGIKAICLMIRPKISEQKSPIAI